MTSTRRQLQPRKQPRQHRSELTRQRILDAAAHVFAEHGYAAGTTNRIAERAGVSIGSVYQYFPNKDALVVELARRHIAQIAETASLALEALVEYVPPLRDGLTAIVLGTVELHKGAPGLQR